MLRRRTLVYVSVVLVVGWLTFLTISTGRAPDPGAASPHELAETFERSLRDRDAETLGRMIDLPFSEQAAFAEGYLEELSRVDASEISVALDGGQPPSVSVRVATGDGRTIEYRQRIGSSGDRWKISLVPAL
ncbi:hypothetical protein ACQPZF_05860 [Actinosynnema sp. CS-041913]|uniref:hypothetical protein n=1 Tax=Actinosynnema sp. CS-041913 TaxID=3239917 RepID=UPI003D8ED04D